MTDYIHTGIYHLDIRSFDYEVAHIYEHLLVQSFMNSLSKLGYSSFLSGWISGQTFKDVLFINYAFYNRDVEVAFQRYMVQTRRIDWSLVDNEISRIQSEVQQIAININNEELNKQLRALDSKSFIDHSQPTKTTYHPLASSRDLSSDVISLQRASKKFRNLTVLFGADELSEDEKLAFLRSTPFIHDYIDEIMFVLGAYKQNWGFTTDQPRDGMVGLDIYTVIRGNLRTDEISAQLDRNIDTLIKDIEQHPQQLQEYRDAFLKSSQWEDFPIQYYKWAGVLASRENIAAALTQQNIVSILKKMKFKVLQTQPEHWDAI